MLHSELGMLLHTNLLRACLATVMYFLKILIHLLLVNFKGCFLGNTLSLILSCFLGLEFRPIRKNILSVFSVLVFILTAHVRPTCVDHLQEPPLSSSKLRILGPLNDAVNLRHA